MMASMATSTTAANSPDNMSFLKPVDNLGSFIFFATLCLFEVLLVGIVTWACSSAKARKGGRRKLLVFLIAAPLLLVAISFLVVYSLREVHIEESFDYHGEMIVDKVIVDADVEDSGDGLLSFHFYPDTFQVRWPACTACKEVSLLVGEDGGQYRRMFCQTSCETTEEASSSCTDNAPAIVQACVEEALELNPLYAYGNCNTCSAELPGFAKSQSILLIMGTITSLFSIIIVVAFFVIQVIVEETRLPPEDSESNSIGLARTVSMSSTGSKMSDEA